MILIPSLNNTIAWLIILLLLAVYPANIACLLPSVQAKTGGNLTFSLIRLPIQFLFIWWAYQLTSLPFMETMKTLSVEQVVGELTHLVKSVY